MIRQLAIVATLACAACAPNATPIAGRPQAESVYSAIWDCKHTAMNVAKSQGYGTDPFGGLAGAALSVATPAYQNGSQAYRDCMAAQGWLTSDPL